MAIVNRIRHSKLITNPEDINFIFSSTTDQCTKLSFIMECFGDFNGKRRFNPYDIITVPPGIYGPEDKKNKNTFTTTVGLFIFNRIFIENDRPLFDLLHYISEPITKKTFGKINSKISYAVIEDDVPLESLKRFMQLTQKHMAYVDILSPSFTENMLSITAIAAKKREELMKKYAKGIEEKDPAEVEKMEKELLDYMEDYLKDDPSYDMINSGAKMSKGNNFKKMFGTCGAVKQPDPTKGDYEVITGNYLDGIKPEEYSKFADSLIGGPYSRAVQTAHGGYLEKAFVKAFEHLYTKKDTDCGTKHYINVTLTDKNIKEWMYSYIIEGNQLIELTSKVKDKYIGKTVKLRFAGMCESKDYICNKCAGNLFARLGIENVGVASYAMMSKIKLISMKAFHDSSLKTSHMGDYGYKKIFGL